MLKKEETLDFKKIEFISKSFAHELKKVIKNSDCKIHLINKNESIRKMLKAADSKPEIKKKKVAIATKI